MMLPRRRAGEVRNEGGVRAAAKNRRRSSVAASPASASAPFRISLALATSYSSRVKMIDENLPSKISVLFLNHSLVPDVIFGLGSPHMTLTSPQRSS